MADKIGVSPSGLGSRLLSDLKDIQKEFKTIANSPEIEPKTNSSKPDFLNYLKEAVNDVNNIQVDADKAGMDLASGKQENIHETMLKAAHAELSFNFMVQIRNKVLEAYQEVMRLPV